MNNYDKILNYAKENNGYITTKEIVFNMYVRIWISKIYQRLLN